MSLLGKEPTRPVESKARAVALRSGGWSSRRISVRNAIMNLASMLMSLWKPSTCGIGSSTGYWMLRQSHISDGLPGHGLLIPSPFHGIAIGC